MNETAQKTKVVVQIEFDHDVESPSDKPDLSDGRCNWTLHSFNRRHTNFTNPEELFEYNYETEQWEPDEELRAKMDRGHAFWLGYFEHGMCDWHLSGENPPGTAGDYRWDGNSRAGLLVWYYPEEDMGAKDFEDRREDARRFLEDYTNWANGDCYWFRVYEISTCSECSQEVEGEDIETCGWIIGSEYLQEYIKEVTKDHVVIRVEGEASYGLSIEEAQG